MALSRSDFVDLADSIGLEIKHQGDHEKRKAMWLVVDAILGPLKRSNRNFDKERFIDHIEQVAYHGKDITT